MPRHATLVALLAALALLVGCGGSTDSTTTTRQPAQVAALCDLVATNVRVGQFPPDDRRKLLAICADAQDQGVSGHHPNAATVIERP